MRTRGGSNVEQLNSLMTYFVAQGDKEQAGEVAIELLRRSVPSRRQSSNSTTVTEARRRSALQTLANVGRLTSLIKPSEERLKNSPKSQRLRGELAEMYVASGQAAKAQALLADSIGADTTSLIALEQAAKQLLTAGKMDEACDAYLKVLRRKPELFQNDFYEIIRPFEQKKRLGELADMIIEVGVKRFESYRVAELCQKLVEEENQANEKFKQLYLAMLETPDSSGNSVQALNQIVSYSRTTLGDPELLAKTQDYMIQASLASNSDWNALFYGYSTGSDGRHRNAATSLIEIVGEDEKKAQALEDQIRKSLEEHKDWHEGRAWLGTLLSARKKYDEAQTLLEPLLDKDTKPAPTYTVFWLIGSQIDKHKPMQELALKMYEHSLSNHAGEIYSRGSEFQYTLGNRACQLMKEMGKKAEAREMLLTAAAKSEKTQRNYGNEDYEAYRKISERYSMIASLKEMDFPADALRLSRTFNTSLFDKAGRYDSGQRARFMKQRDELLAEVRKLGGLAVVETMIDAEAAGPHAVDLGITVGERPFTDAGIQSLWIDLVSETRGKPEVAEKLKALNEQLKALKEKRPEDDSLALASAIADDVLGDPKPLRELLQNWMGSADEKQIADPVYRRQAAIVGLVYLARSESEGDRKLAGTIASEKIQAWTWEQRMLLLAEQGKEAVKRKDYAMAQSLWQTLLTAPQSQMILLDLAHAAAMSEMPQLSCDAAIAAASAPENALSTTVTQPKTNSLGQLLSTGNRQNISSSSNSQTLLDPAEVRLAKRLLELDAVWQANKIPPNKVCEALMKITFRDNGIQVNPLCTPVEQRANNNLAIDSVFDRLAKRAKAAKTTDQILAKLPAEDALGHLLSGLALLRNEQSEEALKRYAKVNPEELQALSKETVVQAIWPALTDGVCRAEILRIGIGFVGQNKPTQRYQDVTPFDTLAFKLAQTAIQNNHPELGFQAINDYLEITQHDNDRYSSGNYGLTRRIEQLNNVSRILTSKGHIDKALSYAGMRQSLFEMGLDTANDEEGARILQRISNMPAKKKAYQSLADWTFAGDGPLNVLSALVHRQPLPAWIPEEVGGKYPVFPPVATKTFPIVSNWYVLAKLAVETKQTEDLLRRLNEAHEKPRAGSAEALAIALAAMGQDIPKELLAEVSKRMDEIAPQGSQPKSALPLPAMQLATILAEEPKHADWSRRMADKLEKHGHKVGRRFLMPWLFQFQYEQKWTDHADMKSAFGLDHWLPGSLAPAKEYADGLTPPFWLTDGQSQLHHLSGISEDRNWFRYPLDGDFEFHFEMQDGDWRESSLIANGARFTMGGTAKTVEVVSGSGRDWVRFPTKTIGLGKWNKYTLRYQGDSLTFLANDVPICKEPRQQSAPWIALHATGPRTSATRNIHISGTPKIRSEVNLLVGETLHGWSGSYYNQILPTTGLNEDVHEPDVEKAVRIRTGAKPDQLANLAWTMKDGELISGNAPVQAAAGRKGQSVIRYERPIAQGETLAYEFHYEAGKTAVHPAIGRTAYMLHPEGVHLHWMSEPQKAWKLPHDYEAPASADNPEPLPLKEADWNRVTLQLNGNQLQIRLNEELVFEKPIEILPQGTIFGLFHYADKTKARVKNITLTGPWPESVPENLFSHSETK